MPQDTFNALTEFLNASGLNYSVFLQHYSVPHSKNATPIEVITAALGESAIVGNCSDIDAREALDEMEGSLRYAGDSGAGPSPHAIQSERFAILLQSALAEMAAIASRASVTQQFWLKDGHPAYPVFWDFAFLFRGEDESTILIGSSSD